MQQEHPQSPNDASLDEDAKNTRAVASHPSKLADAPDDQAWFWTPEWQAGEKEATAEIQKGQLSKKLRNAKEIRDYLSGL